MKICFVLNQLYKSGGIERTISHRLDELSKSHEVFVITMDNGNKPYFFGKSINVHYIDINSAFKRKKNEGFKKNISNVLLSVLAYKRLQTAITKIKPDITINVVGMHSLIFIPFMLNKGVTVLEHHSSSSQDPASKFKKTIMKRYNHHIFLTEEEAQTADFLERKVIIPNPIKTIEKIPDYFSRENRIIAAGRIVQVKGFDRLINAWSIICSKYPNWVLEIYGEANVEILKGLNKLISELKIEERVEFKSATPHITEVMLNSKIYAMTSHYECYPMVLLEAMSAGMLVISFDCPTGPRNIINEDIGILVENNNIQAFSKELESAIIDEHKSSCLARKAYEHSFNYNINSTITKWNNLFHKIST